MVAGFGYSEHSNISFRPYMEDRCDYKDGLDKDSTAGIWGIYDGHMGTGISEHLKEELIKQLD